MNVGIILGIVLIAFLFALIIGFSVFNIEPDCDDATDDIVSWYDP